MNVVLVASDDHLTAWTGGASNLADIVPEEWTLDGQTKTAQPALQQALANVLLSLSRRRPPIREADIVDPTELRQAVVLGALALLYRAAVTHEDSPNVKRADHFDELYRGELDALQPSTRQGLGAPSLSMRLNRG